MPGPQGVPRADIVALLREGHSDRYIGRTLHTATRRVGRIRAELDIPRTFRPAVLTVEEKWRTFTTPVDGGHLAWTGHLREGTTPMFMLRGHNYSARRVAFRIANGREPEGRVLPGCDFRGCVEPNCMEDALMRAQFTAIFGTTGVAG
ncbi:hypothetical protein K4749_01090 [Streptomyces sp. TRM72054]|uniref:hypothetical protein n=1 Tax=Streptomyces sp. TRM72054 TaxID=2870562 RepID=UPI001C8CDADA|nr:hypothetical protein [Streptomyces sp. TRM72054]MBX9392225.1 hypothetical protein [Streptomyces sp. TRM72054]